jgi:putative radical SAM enzyme (TIGR03279 family)
LRMRRAKSLPQGWSPPLITELREGSPCGGVVRPGDRLLEINGRSPLDILDYMDASSQQRVSLRLLRDEVVFSHVIRKRPGVPLGLVFDEPVFDGVRTCSNSCIFCFVDQMPQGLRGSLYLKDDDYRLSFYYGNFITLNNLSREDLERIKGMRIAPLYVSLHTTNPVLRGHIMGGDAGHGITALSALLAEGLEIHLQVVVCPGINDGGELRRTLRDVLEGYAAASLGVVPVGLTAHAHALAQTLQPHDRGSAQDVLEAISEYQELAMARYGRRLFFAADEFYLLAGKDFPPQEEYDDYPQLENGIGMARKFVEEVKEEADLLRTGRKPLRGVVTGVAGMDVMRLALQEAGLEGVETIAARNNLFGASVTVAALLGGEDIISALREESPSARELLIPVSMLREGRFIDDLTPADVGRETGYRLVAVEVEGARMLHALFTEDKS